LKSSAEKSVEYEEKLKFIGDYEMYSLGFTYAEYLTFFDDDIETIKKNFKPQSKKRKGKRNHRKRNSDDEEDHFDTDVAEEDTDYGEEEFMKKLNERDSESWRGCANDKAGTIR
jgi:hypothetical protein